MKKRLANKIMNTVAVFKNWDSNYQPYSENQQRKAIKAINFPLGIREICLDGVCEKMPVEYRKYNPVQVVLALDNRGMNPRTIKEFRACMREIIKS